MDKTKKSKAKKPSKKAAPNKFKRFLPIYWSRKVKIIAAVLLVAGVATFVGLQTYLPISVKAPTARLSMKNPVSIKLNQTLSKVETEKIKLTPNVEGAWEYKRGNLLNGDILTFTPKKYFKEDTAYTATFPAASRMLGGTVQLPDFTFTTEKAPDISKQVGMGSWQQGYVMAADSAFTAALESPNNETRVLELRAEPAIKFKLTVKDDKTYTWQPESMLPQGADFTIELYDSKNKESLIKLAVKTAAEPGLTSPQHRAGVDENDTITLTFSEPIKEDTAKISFDTPGSGAWQNDTTYAFKPQKLAPGKTYGYTIAKDMRSKAGGLLMADIAGSYTTFGPIAVVATAPGGSNLAQHEQTISFTFSRPVNQASAVQRLSISAGKLAGTYWKGNTLYATVKDIGFQRSFSATVAAGVVNANFGLPSNRAYSLGFTTEARSARLNVPMYRQQHRGTCTAASLRMILSYRGIQADEMTIVHNMSYNPRNKDTSTDPPTWDDPMVMFVGNVDGSIKDGTGAGPDAPPVAKAARALGRGASSVTGIGAGWIAEQIYAGNPVVMFGSFARTGTTTWKTPSGGTAVMNLTGHATVVTGVVGEPYAPLGFWVNDPLGGTSYWSTGAVEANIARDPYRQAVVVY